MLSPQLLELLCDLWQYAPCACAYLRGPSPLQRTTQTAPLQTMQKALRKGDVPLNVEKREAGVAD